MFLLNPRFILKTCGTTTPLQCLDDLVTIVKRFAGFDVIEDICYSRKNFERPELQGQKNSISKQVAIMNSISLLSY